MIRSPLQPVYQHPRDLTLGWLGGTLPIQLNVLAESAIQGDAWRIAFRIIGESHCVSISDGADRLRHELLACIPLSPRDCLHYHSFSDYQRYLATPYDYHESGYQVRVALADRRPSIPDSADSALEVDFPPIFGQSPITRIVWHAERNAVRWWTLHVYPQPDGPLYVTSESRLEILFGR